MTSELSATVECHRCGYDLRAQPGDGVCPECAASVAESREIAKVPKRPAWGDSDPRWRRRILAGLWVLLLVPVYLLVDALLDVSARVPVPTVFDYRGGVRFLSETSLLPIVRQVLYPVGLVLLFSRERFRRRHRLDWTRRWGVFGCYLLLPLGLVGILFIGSLVLAGIGALLMSMPLRQQPEATDFIIGLGHRWVRYAPQSSRWSEVALLIISMGVVLLACVPLYHALRSVGAGWMGRALLASIVGGVGVTLVILGLHLYGHSVGGPYESSYLFFHPGSLAHELIARYLPHDARRLGAWGATAGIYHWAMAVLDLVKLLALLIITLWLTVAQVHSWRRRSEPPAPAGNDADAC